MSTQIVSTLFALCFQGNSIRNRSRPSSSPLLSVYVSHYGRTVRTEELCPHKFINDKQDLPETYNFFILSSHIHLYQTRHSNDRHLPFCQTSSHQFNISFRGPKVWNDPSLLRLTSSRSSFKRLLKDDLLSS